MVIRGWGRNLRNYILYNNDRITRVGGGRGGVGAKNKIVYAWACGGCAREGVARGCVRRIKPAGKSPVRHVEKFSRWRETCARHTQCNIIHASIETRRPPEWRLPSGCLLKRELISLFSFASPDSALASHVAHPRRRFETQVFPAARTTAQ